MTERLRLHVDGRWCAPETDETLPAVNPATGDELALIALGTRADAQRAVKAAREGAREWARATAFERAAAMERIARIIEERREELARVLTLDQGKPLATEARAEVEELILYWRMAAADATRLEGHLMPSVDARKRVFVQRVPRGVVAVISPWNWPYTMAAEIIAPALAAGNSVVWNPALHTSLCSVRLAECIAEADLPAGVFNLVTGRGAVVGDELAGHPAVAAVGFVGSTATGLRVAARAAGKDLLLEMGGNGPLVVLDDADLDAAVAATLEACFLNAGQSCTAGERLLVQESVHGEFVERLAAAVERDVRPGDPLAPDTSMGPLNNAATAGKTERHVADALARGARLVAGGRRVEGLGSRLFHSATILDGVTDEMEVAQEETFGPVAPVSTIADESEALALMEASPYGLLSAVFTRDVRRGLRFAEAARSGWVNINAGTNYWESHLPFGGRAGSLSGIGRVGGRFSLERLTELKTVVLDLA